MDRFVVWILINLALWLLAGVIHLLISFIMWSWLPYNPLVLRWIGVLIAIASTTIFLDSET